MPPKKQNGRREYHKDGFTYDQRKKSFTVYRAEDPVRKKTIQKTYQVGGVGPETVEMNKKRYQERVDLLLKHKGERFTASGKKISRGTSSSAVRKIMK